MNAARQVPDALSISGLILSTYPVPISAHGVILIPEFGAINREAAKESRNTAVPPADHYPISSRPVR
jgi:hypothetical protein